MKLHLFYIYLIFGIAVSGYKIGNAQSYDQIRAEIMEKQTNTRAEINVLDARIKQFVERLAKTDADYNKSFKKFENLNTLISLQDDKIKGLETEKSQLEEEIRITQQEIETREDELKHLQENLKKILLYSYKNNRVSNLELLLTAESFNQMLVRSYYLNKVEDQKTKQANKIKESRVELAKVRIDLKQGLNRNTVLLEEITGEKKVLNGQLDEQKVTVETIKTQRTALQSELQKNQAQREALESTFAALLSEEEAIRRRENERLANLDAARRIPDERTRNAEMARYSTAAGVVSEDMLKSFNTLFASKQGRLEWPVDSRTISKKFGKTRNPIYGTVTEHLGVNIVTEPRSIVNVVSDGYVFVISPISGFGDVVFVNHGGYYTAYGNLSQIDVVKNQVLKAGDRIGLSGGINSPLGENVFFMVRKEKTNLNPQDWLSK